MIGMLFSALVLLLVLMVGLAVMKAYPNSIFKWIALIVIAIVLLVFVFELLGFLTILLFTIGKGGKECLKH
ncbi:MAG: hypothetical protein JSW41_00410 [Candidatus Aenigmatarchaeota archaeon]|nr:MAG: hypothetical protein JSW41_00410 [Candidatus Aenigmarchaeota archaeon]